MMELCWLCLGSNCGASSAMPLARNRLTTLFTGIRFGTEQSTRPVNFHSSLPFVNQVACFRCSWSIDKIKLCFKEIERECGRKQEDKLRGLVKMDIDLLVYGNEVLKPEDMQRTYIRHGMSELQSGQRR